MTYHETWLTEFCPHCKAKNWLNLGDQTNSTTPDVDAYKCWSCEKRSILDPDNIKDYYSDDVREWANPEDRDDEYEYNTVEEWLNKGAWCMWGKRYPDDEFRICENEP